VEGGAGAPALNPKMIKLLLLVLHYITGGF
jgi:hypothetical protein